MKHHKIFTLIFLLTAVACNKKDDFFYKGDMLPVTVKGYNGDAEPLLVKVDTFKFKNILTSGSFDQSEAYTFPGNQHTVKLTISGQETGKVILEKELKKGDGPTTISFFYMNGQVMNMPQKQAKEDGKIKISYLFNPTLTHYDQPVDIVLGKYYFTPKVFEEIIRIKNVKPNEFSETVTLSTFSTTGQQYNGQNTAVLFKAYIYKAGTNEFYTQGTPYTWHATSSSAPTPSASTPSSTIHIFSESETGNSIRFNKNLEL
ncbi:hypothetical protein HHL17_09030 [Chitinophaga sp. G-6-1-13]|uniref:Uncharacterized protein n=1 Tax=Chitinophaga fulva TaxID=2728842 RepID=A0A848GKW2_9BACT|nr:hypothetical protein [Chitinophaga fulva]NML37340.1 hypothetical protein [Chitinophaga fulva]